MNDSNTNDRDTINTELRSGDTHVIGEDGTAVNVDAAARDAAAKDAAKAPARADSKPKG